MKKLRFTFTLFLSLMMTGLMGQEYTTPFNHSLMNEKFYDLIIKRPANIKKVHIRKKFVSFKRMPIDYIYLHHGP